MGSKESDKKIKLEGKKNQEDKIRSKQPEIVRRKKYKQNDKGWGRGGKNRNNEGKKKYVAEENEKAKKEIDTK